jgi:hypothetical protein
MALRDHRHPAAAPAEAIDFMTGAPTPEIQVHRYDEHDRLSRHPREGYQLVVSPVPPGDRRR